MYYLFYVQLKIKTGTEKAESVPELSSEKVSEGDAEDQVLKA